MKWELKRWAATILMQVFNLKSYQVIHLLRIRDKKTRISILREEMRGRLRWSILKRDNFTCQYCKRTNVPLHVDHKIPLIKGGTNHPANLVTACATCNLGKGVDVI